MKRISWLFLCGIALMSCSKVSEMDMAEEKRHNPETEQFSESSLIPGEVVVKLTEELASEVEQFGIASTKSEMLTGALEQIGLISAERVFPEAGEFEQKHREAGLHLFYRLHFDYTKPASTKAAVDLSQIEGIMDVEHVRRIKKTAVFNDPYLSRQWHYINPGNSPTYKAGADVNVKPVWEKYTTGSPDVIVAVIDEGVELTHQDLADHTIRGGADGSKCFLFDFPGYTIYAGDHGTHVAGTISAVNNNEIGVCGIAGGDGSAKTGVKIMSCQILMEDPQNSKHVYQGNSDDAFVWAADHGAVIAQNSWGYDYDTAAQAARGNISASTRAAIDYFIKNAGTDSKGNQIGPMKGGLVIFAAGNDGWPNGWPAQYDGNGKCIAVGSIASNGERAYYSNYGDWVDICAPGGDYQVDPMVLSCITGNQYGNMQGTSMACPHVSGVAALVVSYFGGPGFTNDMLVERLLGGENKSIVPSYSKIGGLVDAFGAFAYGDSSIPEKVDAYTADVVSNRVTLSFNVTADGDQTALGYMICASKDKAVLESMNPRTVPSGVASASTDVPVGAKVGDPMSAVISGLDFDSSYYICVYAYDYSRNFSPISDIRQVNTLGNNAPQITTSYTGDYRVHSFETLNTTVEIADPDGHDFTVAFDGGSDAAVMKVIGGVYNLFFKGSDAPAGKYTATLSATDQFGKKGEMVIDYEILANQKPEFVKQMPDIQFTAAKQNVTVNMEDFIKDPDGEILNYSVTSTPKNVVHCFPTGNSMSITALGFGLAEVTIEASDAAGDKCTQKFKVLVRDDSTPVDVYPNPAKNYVYVRPGVAGETTVTIYNQAGAKMFENTANISAFDPMSVDVSGFPGGVYTVVVKGEKFDVKYNIAKI